MNTTPETIETLLVKLTEAEARADRYHDMYFLMVQSNSLSRQEAANLHRQVCEMQRRIDRQTSTIGALKAQVMLHERETL